MSGSQPTMRGHLAHGDWGMEITEFTHDEGVGSFTLGACDVCHLLIAECAHEKNVWRDEMDSDGNPTEVLRCELCGIDGT